MQRSNSELDMARPDVALLLDSEGVIRDVTLSRTFSAGDLEDWIGRPWVDTVRDIGDEKVRRMVEEANLSGVSAFRQFTQRFPSGLELPMEYTTVQLGESGSLLAIGKNLQAVAEMQSRLVTAQQAMEREYWKLRYLETRYRLLLESSNEPVLLVKDPGMNILEANPSASKALGIPSVNGSLLERTELFDLVDTRERQSLVAMLQRVREQGNSPAMLLHLGQDHEPWYIKASLVHSEQGPVFFLQLTSPVSPQQVTEDTVSFEQLLETAPDALVMIDEEGTILKSNSAFLRMIQVAPEASVAGQSLARWLGRPGADIKVLLASLALHGTVRLFATTVEDELGVATDVEISAVAKESADGHRIGLVLRDVGSRLPLSGMKDKELGAWLNTSTKQIGTSPLRKLVKDTVGVVESHYIKAALELTKDNRTAAAEILGLSRQSLYAKMNRYGIGSGRGSNS